MSLSSSGQHIFSLYSSKKGEINNATLASVHMLGGQNIYIILAPFPAFVFSNLAIDRD